MVYEKTREKSKKKSRAITKIKRDDTRGSKKEWRKRIRNMRQRLQCARCKNFPNVSHKLKNAETTPQEVCEDYSAERCYDTIWIADGTSQKDFERVTKMLKKKGC